MSYVCVDVCLLGRNLETDCITLLFHCWYMYYLETADSVAQPFLHGANTPHCSLIRLKQPNGVTLPFFRGQGLRCL
jgi:hypothetical protein